ncbi:MAG: alpha/beta hydrolase [Opitutales bacterium]|nr:alpha/beta hydrolase [Opitutales bacterium]NRA26048.1 alpha/beta hydrolase [Opitutales bacterium]
MNDKIQYVEAGFSFARLNYRYATEAPYPAQLDDVKAALLLICEEAEYFNIDKNNIFLAGHSAGAHLAACLGHAMVDSAFPVSAIACDAGPMNFISLWEYRLLRLNGNPGGMEILLGHSVDADPESAKRASPYHLITDRSPAHFLSYGSEDVVVPPQQGEIYAEALDQAGIDASLTIYEGAGHGSPCFFDSSHNEAVIEFFTKHLS